MGKVKGQDADSAITASEDEGEPGKIETNRVDMRELAERGVTEANKDGDDNM